jgi:hypothetical protein
MLVQSLILRNTTNSINYLLFFDKQSQC